jgi:hypothetical protein
MLIASLAEQTYHSRTTTVHASQNSIPLRDSGWLIALDQNVPAGTSATDDDSALGPVRPHSLW